MPKAFRSMFAFVLSTGLALPLAAEEIGPDTVVARVGETSITLGHMIVMRAQLPPEYQQLPDDVLYEAVLDQLIRQSAVADSIGDDLSLGARLALENEQRSYIAGEALSRVAQEAVTDETIQAAYEAAYAAAEPEREYNAAHILVKTEDEAKAIRAELDGGADFAELAKTKSTGPSGPNGGDLGWFTKGMMVKPFEDAVLGLEPGQVSDPVETQFGWHVVTLRDSRIKQAPALDEVRDDLVQQIQRDAMEKAMEDLTAAADIERPEVQVDPALLNDRSLLDQ
ncbi:peptidyl-prolyl cis-trans isomerase C [Rhodovulum bhavnagarense]|uniref:Parvulin-like PPIase n=1 Tax=Rhodovulum bhavnagarense TaxID=992286 RepID=A0A4R2RG78_9RHOB|nr:peptidylprolyl isomerase [Rhodovulum bhavnagarense]TCP61087.1 peptidyl-prolyl cis-trans isomerase C [Rhodovulum bhavnagarense]